MSFKEILSFLGPLLGVGIAICSVPLMMYVIFPFFQSLSPEKRFEKFIDDQCLLGNEIAILIRREGTRYYLDKDFALIRAAIEGNENAVRALKLDSETLKKKNY